MENTNVISASNIVAAAMSSANLITPDSPKYACKSPALQMTSAMSVKPSSSLPRQNSVQVKTEIMETVEPLPSAHVLIGQDAKNCDPLSQPLVNPNDVSPAITRKPTDDKSTKEFVERNNTATSQLISVTSVGEAFTIATVNGDAKEPLSSIGTTTVDGSAISMTMEVPAVNSPNGKPESRSNVNLHQKPSDETVYSITCGPNRAELVWRRFICPGINADCVKSGENWYTPKEFVALAGKATLKDWKRAIRINGVMLRRLIENGELSYYEHETNCSNLCRSNKEKSFDGSCEKSFDSDQREVNGKDIVVDVTSVTSMPRTSSEEQNHYPNKKAALSALHKSLDGATSVSNRNSLERSSSEDSGMPASPHIDGMLMRDTPITLEKLQELERFWNSAARLDFFDEIICDLVTQIRSLHGRVKVTGSINVEDVVTLTNLVNSLEMFPNIVHRMSLHKHKVEKDAEESCHVIQELEKKLAEHKKYEQDLKRKSRHLDNVMLLTPNEKRPKRNIIRIGRQKAVVEARIPPGTSSQTTQTPDIRENVMLAAANRAGIGQREMWSGQMQVDSLARVAATSQMAAHMNNTAISAGLPPFSIFPQLCNSTEVLSPLQAFVSSPQNSQSPKK